MVGNLKAAGGQVLRSILQDNYSIRFVRLQVLELVYEGPLALAEVVLLDPSVLEAPLARQHLEQLIFTVALVDAIQSFRFPWRQIDVQLLFFN